MTTATTTLYDIARTSPRGVTHAVDVDGDGKTMCGIWPRSSTKTMQSRPQVDCERCRASMAVRAA
jgi:hypothetical protein